MQVLIGMLSMDGLLAVAAVSSEAVENPQFEQHGWMARLKGHPSAMLLELEPLSSTSVMKLMCNQLQVKETQLPPELKIMIVTKVEGNAMVSGRGGVLSMEWQFDHGLLRTCAHCVHQGVLITLAHSEVLAFFNRRAPRLVLLCAGGAGVCAELAGADTEKLWGAAGSNGPDGQPASQHPAGRADENDGVHSGLHAGDDPNAD